MCCVLLSIGEEEELSGSWTDGRSGRLDWLLACLLRGVWSTTLETFLVSMCLNECYVPCA